MSDKRRELEDVRRQMSEVDADILKALLRRAQLARQVGALGPMPASTLSIAVGPDREQLAVLEKIAGDDLPPEVVRGVFREIHAALSFLERSSRVAYVGPEGGFAQVAAQRQFGLGSTLTAWDTVAVAVDEVVRQRADYAVIPFESSAEGPVQAAIETLAATDLSLAAKIEVAAQMSAMAKASSSGPFEKIHVYAGDRSAVEKYLAAHPRATVVEARSPLAACQLALQDSASLAIAALPVGEQVGLVVVDANVGDDAALRFRYGLVTSRPTQRSGSDTTAILFGVHDGPGALFDVLKHFAERGINLKTIQSRPRQGENWTYLFYVEVSGHVTDRSVVTALEEIKRETRVLKVLGSFPS